LEEEEAEKYKALEEFKTNMSSSREAHALFE
jgi:hypothetical protein